MHSVWKRWACNVPAEVEEKERGEEEVKELSGRSAITSVTQRDREGEEEEEEEEEECWYQERKMDNRITE